MPSIGAKAPQSTHHWRFGEFARGTVYSVRAGDEQHKLAISVEATRGRKGSFATNNIRRATFINSAIPDD
jgi:hypothetical protein